MDLLLTSAGVTNASIRGALVELLGKPIDECRALVVPTGIHPFPGGPEMAAQLVRGEVRTPLCDLGWRGLGLLELTALPSISRDAWVPSVQAADALLVWGGDPLFLSFWLQESGLAELLLSLDSVYVGVSAGAMAACSTFGETYLDRPSGPGTPLTTEDLVLPTPTGDVRRTFVTAAGAGLVDVALIPHLNEPDHPDASLANARIWAAKVPAPTYALDDQSALRVVDGSVGVVSEGAWQLFPPET